ncbi:MAG: hypothetical protein KAU91_07095 [Candidatus Aminicenantes bacterium]|nr:hypothetical protein [Candidatus Aminicenantes bacterium]
MPQTPEPVGKRPVWDRQTPSKVERIFSYCVISIVVLLGVLVLMGAFGISSQFKGIIGVILIGYGLIRFLLMKTKFDRRKESTKERLREGDKEADKTLRS